MDGHTMDGETIEADRVVPRLHLTTNDAVLARPDWLGLARDVVRSAGASVSLHLRGPGTSAAKIFELVGSLAEAAKQSGATLVLNDRVDVALATGTLAVHLGQRSLSAAVVRELLGPESVIGVSCHGREELLEAEAAGADYAFLGPVFETASHPDREGIGVERWSSSSAELDLPLIGIGGIRIESVAALRSGGAHGVAVIRSVWDEPDPLGAVFDYIAALERA